MSSRRLLAAYEYDAFGQTQRATGPLARDLVFRFSTKWTDAETGELDYGRRRYSPSLGRFTSRDPIEEKGGVNLYAFVRNNPVSRWDYLGMRYSRAFWKYNSLGLGWDEGGEAQPEDADSEMIILEPFVVHGGPSLELLLNVRLIEEVEQKREAPKTNKPEAPSKPDPEREKRKKDCDTLKGMIDTYSRIGREQIDEIGVTGRELNRVGDVFAYGGYFVTTGGAIFDTIHGAYKAGAEAVEQVNRFNDIVDGTPFLIHETSARFKSGYAASVELSTYATEGLKSGAKTLGEYWFSTEMVYNKVNDVLHDTINAEMRSLSLNHADTMNRLKNTQNEFKAKGCDEFY